MTGNTSLNQRTGTNHCILSGETGAVNRISDDSYHVVKINANNTLLDMVTFQGGNANGAGQDGYGGCIYNMGDASLVGCIVRQGIALSGGNLIFNDGMLKLIGGLYNIPMSTSISTLYNAVGSGIEVIGNVQIKHQVWLLKSVL